MLYQHTQKVPDSVMAIAAAAGLAAGLTPPGLLMRIACVGLMGAAAYTFRSLTVEVDENEIRLQYGDGPVRKSFKLADVTEAKVIRTSPLAGWGVRYIGNGWLYNIYGLDAVQVTFAGNKHVTIGSDEPDELVAAINARPIDTTAVPD